MAEKWIASHDRTRAFTVRKMIFTTDWNATRIPERKVRRNKNTANLAPLPKLFIAMNARSFYTLPTYYTYIIKYIHDWKINIPYNKAPVTESFDALHPVIFVSSPPSSVVFVSVVYTYADCLKNAPKLAIISFRLFNVLYKSCYSLINLRFWVLAVHHFLHVYQIILNRLM